MNQKHLHNISQVYTDGDGDSEEDSHSIQIVSV